MILSRLLYFFFRFAEFVCGVVVLGIVGHFIHQYRHGSGGPITREIYAEVVAGITTFFSLIWLLPFTWNFLHYPLDFLFSAAWFGAFAALVNWIRKANCGGVFHWAGLANGSYCGQWKAAEAFSFIAACFWLASALLGVHVWHNLRARNAAAAPAPAATTTRRRRWGRRHVV
jgi:hypothetical protein